MDNHLIKLDWDSDFFGYPIGRINARQLNSHNLTQLVNEARAGGFQLLYLFANPADQLSNESAKENKAKLADQKVTFRIVNNKMEFACIDQHIIDYPTQQPSAKLVELSLQSGVYSRYKIDDHFKHNEFEKLYRAWIENSVSKKIADHTFVYIEDGKELGVVTAKLRPEGAQIGIIAVDEHTRGKSIGSKLMNHLLAVLKSKHIPLLDVATQVNNTNACNFYKKLGFEVHTLENIFHIWL